MAENVINVRGSRQKIRRIMETVRDQVRDTSSEAAKQLMVRMGLTLLGRIKAAFIVKANGGVDDCGLQWPKLKKSTVAYSRRHPGVPPSSKRAGFSPSWMLTKKQRERWWSLYRQFLGKAPQGAAYHQRGAQAGSGWAAARAWKILKSEGAQTLMMVYGDTPVKILRSTGVLLNSLSPGVSPMEAKPQPPTVEDQVFRLGVGDVIVGTNRKFAVVHHEGRGHVPQRRLWAEPDKWPANWWLDITEQGQAALLEMVIAEMQK